MPTPLTSPRLACHVDDQMSVFMASRLSFVVPVALEEDKRGQYWRDLPDAYCSRRFQLLLDSFLRAFDARGLERFLIVCPARDLAELTRILRTRTADSRFEVMPEEHICPELEELRSSGHAVPGWYVQQILKLAAARELSVPFYLTLDSDIVCRRSFAADDLVHANQALLNLETPLVYLRSYRLRPALNELYYKYRRLFCSARLLGYLRNPRYWHRSYGETPVLMHTESVERLLAHLSRRHGDWVRCLATNSGWTEYTLLFQYLEHEGDLERFYRVCDHNAVLDLDSSVWKSSSTYRRSRDFSATRLADQTRNAGPFIAIQSYLPTHEWLPQRYGRLEDFYSELEAELFGPVQS